MQYEGISSETLFLLAENRFQDSKSFYEEHKAAIKAGAIDPLRRLAADLTPTMHRIDPLLVTDPLTNGCVSRVRRDNRFTHDKTLYRENLWVAFMRDKRTWETIPAFYLDFSLRRAEWGMGFYRATPAVMQCLRRRTDADPAGMLRAVKKAQKAGFTLGGEPYARPRSGADTPALLRPLYDCRSIELSRSEPPEFVADAGLPERLIAGFEALAPVYRRIVDAVEEVCGYRDGETAQR